MELTKQGEQKEGQMGREIRVKIKSVENPSRFKYITTYAVKVGDTLTFKWNKQWVVVKIINKIV